MADTEATTKDILQALREAQDDNDFARIMDKHVIDDDDRQFLDRYKTSILAILNGIYPAAEQSSIVQRLKKWNQRIGAKFFTEKEG